MVDDNLHEKVMRKIFEKQNETNYISSNEFIAEKTCFSDSGLEKEVFTGKSNQETFSLAPR